MSKRQDFLQCGCSLKRLPMRRQRLKACESTAMQFSTFIEQNLDEIIDEWVHFARTLRPAADSLTTVALKNHSKEILLAIVKDMRSPQTDQERHDKSQRMKVLRGAPETAAVTHGAIRQMEGLDLPQLVGEFRALRATALRLWRDAIENVKPDAVEEIARFNEGIDQALAESVERYADDVRASRELFLGMVGHDLRGPLWVVDGSVRLLKASGLSKEPQKQALDRIARSSKVMDRLIADMLTYSRTQIAGQIPIERHPCDFGALSREAIDAIQATYPQRAFELDLVGDLKLVGDEVRLQQVLTNLLHNAVQHGKDLKPVSLRATGEPEGITLTVRSAGAIPRDALPTIFEPLSRATDQQAVKDRWKTSLGLGLFIVREIARAHGGRVAVESSEMAGTTFTVQLPRTPEVSSSAPSE